MTAASPHPFAERLLMAGVALLFLLQPLASAAGSCTLRARLFGQSCCCAASGSESAQKSCCAQRAQHGAPAQRVPTKNCGCQLSAPPLVPPAGAFELPSWIGLVARLAHASAPACARLDLELAARVLGPPRSLAPPGFASCFHARLDAGLARALAFERNLRS